MAFDTVASFDDMKEAIKNAKGGRPLGGHRPHADSVEEFKGIPEDLVAVTEAIAGMRAPIQTELTAAFDTGGVDAFVDKARFFRKEVIAQFPPRSRRRGADATAKAKAGSWPTSSGCCPRTCASSSS